MRCLGLYLKMYFFRTTFFYTFYRDVCIWSYFVINYKKLDVTMIGYILRVPSGIFCNVTIDYILYTLHYMSQMMSFSRFFLNNCVAIYGVESL